MPLKNRENRKQFNSSIMWHATRAIEQTAQLKSKVATATVVFFNLFQQASSLTTSIGACPLSASVAH